MEKLFIFFFEFFTHPPMCASWYIQCDHAIVDHVVYRATMIKILFVFGGWVKWSVYCFCSPTRPVRECDSECALDWLTCLVSCFCFLFCADFWKLQNGEVLVWCHIWRLRNFQPGFKTRVMTMMFFVILLKCSPYLFCNMGGFHLVDFFFWATSESRLPTDLFLIEQAFLKVKDFLVIGS